MNSITHPPVDLSSEEIALVAQLLQTERNKLYAEIAHTDHRAFRDDLKRRLTLVEHLAERWQPA